MSIPQLVKKEVNKIVPNSEVILFGSRARGEARQDSDWDFLILLNLPTPDRALKNEILDALYDVELNEETVISSLIHTKAEWQKRSITPIFKIIKEEGIAA